MVKDLVFTRINGIVLLIIRFKAKLVEQVVHSLLLQFPVFIHISGFKESICRYLRYLKCSHHCLQFFKLPVPSPSLSKTSKYAFPKIATYVYSPRFFISPSSSTTTWFASTQSSRSSPTSVTPQAPKVCALLSLFSQFLPQRPQQTYSYYLARRVHHSMSSDYHHPNRRCQIAYRVSCAPSGGHRLDIYTKFATIFRYSQLSSFSEFDFPRMGYGFLMPVS